jgi:hypothetical protein
MPSNESYDANAYSARATTGVLGATLAAGSVVFSMYNGGTKTAYVDRIVVGFGVTVTFTAASQLLFAFERLSVAAPTGGTAYTPMKHSTTQAASTITDVRASTTTALSTTGVTFEGNQIPMCGFGSPAAGLNNPLTYFDFNDDPIRLAPTEGLCFRNLILWPAAGTGVITGMVSWADR